MSHKPSLVRRIAAGKIIGFLLGLVGFYLIPYFSPDETIAFRLGVLFWYTTLGAVIGVFGVFTYHPILKLPMPWWFRSALLGGWMNFVLMLLLYDKLSVMMEAYFGLGSVLNSPLWIIVEGMMAGLLCGYVATKWGGEGKETLNM